MTLFALTAFAHAPDNHPQRESLDENTTEGTQPLGGPADFHRGLEVDVFPEGDGAWPALWYREENILPFSILTSVEGLAAHGVH
ncbi:hypothetical protein BC628DRAFT_1422885 [Trametes gibbosa]|nr:hypothetical protein BC628DRAFT_1422885 [Trametes gibbosa]